MFSNDSLKYLYLRKVQEVEQRIATRNYYNFMMAAGLLRHLFFDDPSLVEIVRREHCIQIRFEILVATDDASMMWFGAYFTGRQLDPEGVGEMFTRELVAIDRLIATPFVSVDESNVFTVKEILDFCAYVRGGVHDDEPTPKQSLLFADASGVFTGHWDLMTSVREIARIILRGLRPLTMTVYSELVARNEAAERAQQGGRKGDKSS